MTFYNFTHYSAAGTRINTYMYPSTPRRRFLFFDHFQFGTDIYLDLQCIYASLHCSHLFFQCIDFGHFIVFGSYQTPIEVLCVFQLIFKVFFHFVCLFCFFLKFDTDHFALVFQRLFGRAFSFAVVAFHDIRRVSLHAPHFLVGQVIHRSTG